MKRSRGFSMEVLGQKFYVWFSYHNDKVTKCYLKTEEKEWPYCKTYVGVAKRRDEDEYVREDGENVAFDKAMDKYSSTVQKKIEAFIDSSMRIQDEFARHARIRLDKYQGAKNA